MIKLTLPFPPVLNHLYPTTRTGKRVKSRAGREYAHTAGWQAKEQGAVPIAGPVAVTIDAYRPRRVGDIDAPLKVLLDALTGIAYEDDGQIEWLLIRRHDDAKNPRVELTIEPVGEQQAQMEMEVQDADK